MALLISNPGTSPAHFPSALDRMVSDYLKAQWDLTGDLSASTGEIRFKNGYFLFDTKYEIAVMQIQAMVDQDVNNGWTMIAHTDVGIALRMFRQDDTTGQPNTELKQMEDKVMDIVGDYDNYAMTGIYPLFGIQSMRYVSTNYQTFHNSPTDRNAEADWRSVITARLFYQLERVA